VDQIFLKPEKFDDDEKIDPAISTTHTHSSSLNFCVTMWQHTPFFCAFALVCGASQVFDPHCSIEGENQVLDLLSSTECQSSNLQMCGTSCNSKLTTLLSTLCHERSPHCENSQWCSLSSMMESRCDCASIVKRQMELSFRCGPVVHCGTSCYRESVLLAKEKCKCIGDSICEPLQLLHDNCDAVQTDGTC
jgi:hypothetical protein